MEVKYSRDVSLPEVRKIVDSYMKGHSYANVIQKVNSLGSNRNNNTNKHRTLIEQLAQPGPNNWPKFQELLKGSCMTEIYQIEIVNKLEELISNPHTAAQIPLIENKTKTPPKANTNRQKSQRSSIRSPNLKIDIPGKFLQKTWPTNEKTKHTHTHISDTHKNKFEVRERIDYTPPKSYKQKPNH